MELLKDPEKKDKIIKVIAVLIIISVAILSFDVFTLSKDGRKQIVDEDGGMEAELCMMLSDIRGVGEVDVMLQYDEEDKVTGAIVTAQGADDPVVRNNVINAVMALFDLSATSVEVFEKNNESIEEDESDNKQKKTNIFNKKQ